MDFTKIILIETIYALALIIPCLIIFFKVKRIHDFSKYKGLMYFSHAFVFFCIGFFIRYIYMIFSRFSGDIASTIQDYNILLALMKFFLILPGFFLLYSIIWKKFEIKKYSKSIITYPEFIIFIITLIIVLLGIFHETLLFFYFSQILLFSISSLISFINLRKKSNRFRLLYFSSMFIFLLIWIVNLFAQYTIDRFPIIRIYTYVATVIGILLFFYITLNLTKDF
jgi:hypothetical protein